jgi:zinc/manganese transport system permease protein
MRDRHAGRAIITTETLSKLYDTKVEVVRSWRHIFVVGAEILARMNSLNVAKIHVRFFNIHSYRTRSSRDRSWRSSAGFVGYFLITRGLTFAGHALSHIGFAGAAAALVFGLIRSWDFFFYDQYRGMGIGFSERICARKISISASSLRSCSAWARFLFLSITDTRSKRTAFFSAPSLASADAMYGDGDLRRRDDRGAHHYFPAPCSFSIDPEVAEARGVPVRFLGIFFLVLVAIAVSMSVQVVGVLLIFTLLVGPAATATRLVQ